MDGPRYRGGTNLQRTEDVMATTKNTHGGRREGAGRPPVNPEGAAVLVSVSIPPQLVEKLDKLAERWDVSRSSAAARVIREFKGKRYCLLYTSDAADE